MAERDPLIAGFLAAAGWAGAQASALAGDASNRRYLRLWHAGKGQGAVVMDAPPERGEDVRPFIRIARHLLAAGFSAPRILAADENAGLLLLEDLGDALYARVLEQQPVFESALYGAATDLLVELHRLSPPAGLAAYDAPLMTELSALAFDWYQAAAAARPEGQARQAFCETFEPLLARYGAPEVLVLRDYHAQNLLWLPGREGLARVGLLDFQDAMIGHPAYDLVSLLQDARRDVAPGIEKAMIDRYVAATGRDADAFRAACCVLGAQRNLRIIGVFARLCLRDGKAGYLGLIPRVWRHLARDLAHPALAPVANLVREVLPDPSPDILTRIERCAAPTP